MPITGLVVAREHQGGRAGRGPRPRNAREPEKLHNALFHGPRSGGLGLVRDLHDLWLLAHEVRLSHEILLQAGQALRDREMETAIQTAMTQTDRQIQWLRSRIDQAAPQALAVRS